jgi:hypothetical protein
MKSLFEILYDKPDGIEIDQVWINKRSNEDILVIKSIKWNEGAQRVLVIAGINGSERYYYPDTITNYYNLQVLQ